MIITKHNNHNNTLNMAAILEMDTPKLSNNVNNNLIVGFIYTHIK